MKNLAEERISIDPAICSGKPCIKGTRITVADVLLAVAEGLSHKEILRNFRIIREDDIKAALAYAYCITDSVPLNIKTGEGKSLLIDNDVAKHEDVQKKAEDAFTKSLEQQAAIQEEITKETLAELKAKKEAEAGPKQEAPPKREYDLEIELGEDESTQIFSSADDHRQGIKMTHDNYIFEERDDGKDWLISSVKQGSVIDLEMKRFIKLHYNGKEAIFEGYLSDDRLHKVFIYRDIDEEKTYGRILP